MKPLLNRAQVDVIVEILRRARPALLQLTGGNTRTCIFSTRVACGVLSRLGISNRPLPVELNVYNPPLWRSMCSGEERKDADDKFIRYYIGTNPPSGWNHVPGDTSHLGKGWNGHLVCLVENRLLLDMSLDQVNRPQYDIELEAAVIEPPAEIMERFLAAPPGDAELTGEAAGCGVSYRKLDDRGYLTAGDWDREHTRQAVLGICDGIEAALRVGRMPSFGTRPLMAGGVA